MLSNTSKYAIRAVIYLALEAAGNKKVSIRKIGSDLHIPAPFLGKILQSLAKHKLLTSTKGPHGGFGIAKDPDQITLFDVVNIIEGNDLFEKCLISMRNCHEDMKPCPLHDSYELIRNNIREMFKTQTIKNLTQNIEGAAERFII